MGPLLLAVLSAVAYGASDFVGGVRSRSVHPVWVTLVSQLVLLVGVFVWLPFRPGTPTVADLGWGALAGLGTLGGTVMLMRGLSAGAMHVAAPVSAVVGAAVPVILAVATGERPSVLAWVGIGLALPALWLVAAGEGGGVRSGSLVPEGAVDGAVAGLGFAAFMYALSRTDAAAGAWPLVAVEVTSVVLLGALLAVWRPPGGPRAALPSWPMGVLALAGTVLYFLAAQQGPLALVVVVASLYPAFTVAMAVLVLRERPTRRQVVGLGLAAAAVVGIALGGQG